MGQNFKLIGLLSCGILLFSFAVKKRETPYEHLQLVGKVKWYTEEDMQVTIDSQGIAHTHLSRKQHEEFDTAGRQLIIYGYTKGRLTSKNVKEYDKQGRVVKDDFFNAKDIMTKSTYYKRSRKTSESFLSKYDTSGRIIYSDKKKFDQANRITREIITDYKKAVTSVSRPHYTESIKSVLEKRKNGNNHKNDKYDSEGNLLERNIYNEDSTIKIRYTWVYNAAGKRIENAMYVRDSSGLNIQYRSFNDSLGRVLYQNNYEGGKLVTVTTNRYVYDSVGNWTIDSVFENNNFTRLMRREIQYY